MTSAGEVEQFAYCPHNWLLARQGHDPHEGSRRGMAEHVRKGEALAAAEDSKRNYRRELVWCLRVTLVALSGLVVGYAIAEWQGTFASLLFLAASLVLLLGSSWMLTLAIRDQNRYRRMQLEGGIVPGRLLASDLASQAPLMEDAATGLSGRPDYVLQTRSGAVPVEVKTGRTPEKPYENHCLQVAAYLRLLEATSPGPAPEYGLVTYPEGTFRVAWTPDLRASLDRTLARIATARETGVADRDHQQVGRCRGCARRDACDQRLA